MSIPEYDPISIEVGGEVVTLDPINLKFNEATLSQFLDSEGSWYDYFGRCLANCETEFAAAKENAEIAYFRAFDEYKSEGATEKLAEARARVETAVIETRERQREADKNVKILKAHLRSWDHSHSNAISMGYTLRKETDLISPRIYGNNGQNNSTDYESKLEELMGRKNSFDHPMQ